MIDVLPSDLLGAHGVQGPHARTRSSHPRRVLESRESEVQDLDVIALAQHDVGALHVAMDDSVIVNGGEPVGDRDSDAQGLRDRQWSFTDPRGQGAAGYVFDHQIGTVAGVIEVVESRDGRVGKLRRGPRLDLEATKGFAIVDEFVVDDLDRDLAAQALVFGEVDFAHASPTEELDDAIVSETFTDHGASSLERASTVAPPTPAGQDLRASSASNHAKGPEPSPRAFPQAIHPPESTT